MADPNRRRGGHVYSCASCKERFAVKHKRRTCPACRRGPLLRHTMFEDVLRHWIQDRATSLHNPRRSSRGGRQEGTPEG